MARIMSSVTSRLSKAATFMMIALILAGSGAWGQGGVSANSGIYQVDAESSDIRILVHRGGALSWLGHSHVISVGQLDGRIYVHPEPKQSRFELIIPVQGLIVDNPLIRREEGDEFSSEITEHDVAGTRSNMLGDRVLNAKRHPVVKLTGTGYRGDKPEIMLQLSIELLGNVVELQVPTTLRLDGDVLEVTGALRLSHSDLGMRPFTALLGALRVGDELDFKYRVRAHRSDVISHRDAPPLGGKPDLIEETQPDEKNREQSEPSGLSASPNPDTSQGR
jgi:hypothetical protein